VAESRIQASDKKQCACSLEWYWARMSLENDGKELSLRSIGMNKREAVLNLLQAETIQEYTPAGFFIHFDPSDHFGQAAVDKHLEYFRYTDMDLVKIQYERTFPYQPNIQKAEDWGKLPLFGKDFFQPQLDAVEGLVKVAKEEAIVIFSVYVRRARVKRSINRTSQRKS
jgi:uroporphyrinogen decarboxylase